MDVNKLTSSDLYRFAEQWMRANPGKSLADFRKATGYNGSPLKVKDTKTGRIGPRFKDTDKARNQRLQAAEQEYLDTLKQGGYSEAEGQQMLQSSTSKHKKLQKQVRSLNKEKGAGSFSVGHMTATEQGGGNFNRNLRLEIGKSKGGNRGNFSRAAKDEIPKSLKPALGIPNSGREAAIMDMSGGQFDLPLTPKDRQQIIRNPQMANEIIARRLQVVENNPQMMRPRDRPVGSQATLNGKPVVWDGKGWVSATSRAVKPVPRARTKAPSRAAMTALAGAGVMGLGPLGTAASAAEVAGRTQIARQSGNWADKAQAGIAGISAAADVASYVPPIAIPAAIVSTAADVVNMGIDVTRNFIDEVKRFSSIRIR